MTTPLLHLRCNGCGLDMIRHTPYGLLVDDGRVTVGKGVIQVCTHCGKEHGPGSVMSFYFKERQYDHK